MHQCVSSPNKSQETLKVKLHGVLKATQYTCVFIHYCSIGFFAAAALVFSPDTPTEWEQTYLKGHCQNMPRYSSIQLLQTGAETFSQWLHFTLKCEATHPERPSLLILACVPVRVPFMSSRNRRVHPEEGEQRARWEQTSKTGGCLQRWTEFKLNILHQSWVQNFYSLNFYFSLLSLTSSVCFLDQQNFKSIKEEGDMRLLQRFD